MADEPNQLDKFKEAARDLETDDESRFKARLARLVKHKPAGQSEDAP